MHPYTLPLSSNPPYQQHALSFTHPLLSEAMAIADHVRQPDSIYHAYAEGNDIIHNITIFPQ